MNLLYYKWFRCSSCNPHTTSRVLTWITRLHDVGASRWYFVFLVNESLPLSSQLTRVLYQYKQKILMSSPVVGADGHDLVSLLRVILTCCSALSSPDWRQTDVQRWNNLPRLHSLKTASTVNLAQLQKRLKKHEGKVPNLQWFHLGFFDFMVMQKRSSFIRNCISIFEFWASPGWQ